MPSRPTFQNEDKIPIVFQSLTKTVLYYRINLTIFPSSLRWVSHNKQNERPKIDYAKATFLDSNIIGTMSAPRPDLKISLGRLCALSAGLATAAALAMLCLYFLLQTLIEWQVRTSILENAGLKARIWSEHLFAPFPDAEQMFTTATVTPGDVRILEASFSSVEMLRFELFKADGARIFSSSPELLDADEEPEDREDALNVYRTGIPALAVHKNVPDKKFGAPITLVEAYVPAQKSNGERVGVIEVQFNVTQLEKALRRAFSKVGWVLILGTIFLLSLPAAALVYRTRQLRSRDLKLLELMRYDQLTGVLNRNSVSEHFDAVFQPRDGRSRIGILFIDVDHFKQFNDQHGHACGDAILRHIAERLLSCVDEKEDIVARFGGDEFLILVRGVDLAGLRALYGRIMEAVMKPCTYDGKPLVTNLSVGVYLTQLGDTQKTGFHRADLALYAAKKRGRGQVVEYSPELETLFGSEASAHSKSDESRQPV
ncbi:GGDEF domain-containing protein [Rhodobacterales bacterium]|nr:GGDEF domain-containing protein [Rhodobacterales bacterium]